ncbi:MAG TPA: YbaK/EbsC family protein [Candidatus Limnocylindrales bacterium]
MKSPIGNFEQAWRAVDRPDLVGEAVAKGLVGLAGADQVLVVDTDPDLADTANFCQAYDVPLEASANCVVVAGKRGQTVTYAACVVLATTRADVNGLVRKHLEARKASFAPMDTAVAETGMEYGGITPIGLPADWPVLVDSTIAGLPHVIVGSGRRRGKLVLPGSVLTAVPGAQTVAGLGL